MTTTTTMPIPDHLHHRETDRGRLHHGSSRTTVPFPLLLLLFLLLYVLCSPAKAQPSGSSPHNPYGSLRGGFGPAMGIIVVVLVSAFFFMVFFSIYLRRCGERGDTSAAPAWAVGGALQGLRSRRSAARGLDPSVIQAFPTLVYVEVKEHKIGKGALECAVCLSEFEDDETLRLLPKCDHVFHTDCIDVWLSSHSTCPVCRSNLDPNAAVTPAEAEAPDAPPADAGSSAAAAREEEETQRDGGGAGGQPQDHVAIVVEEAEAGVRMRRMESKSRLRWRWSRSLARPPRFWRSHSTGHSVATMRPGEDLERYTLRLPDHIRRDVVAGKFQRYPSTSRKGHRAGGEGTSRGAGGGWSGPVGGRSFKQRKREWAAKSDGWSFFARTLSMVITRGDDGQAGEGSARRGVEAPSRRKGEEGGSASAAAATTPGVGEGSVKGKKVFPSGDV